MTNNVVIVAKNEAILYNIFEEGLFFMLQKDKKYLIGLKILATIALACTVVLWCGLWIASATSFDKSYESTQNALDKLDKKYDLSTQFAEKIVTQKVYTSRTNDEILYIGDTDKVGVWFSPSETLDTDVRYESSDPQKISVNENGVVTCHEQGEVYIKVILKSNEAVFCETPVSCYGINPDKEEIKITTKLLEAGTSTNITLNDDNLYFGAATYTSSNEDVAVVHEGTIYGKKAGTTTITATLLKNGKTIKKDIKVTENLSATQPLKKIVFKENPKLYYGKEAKWISTIIERVEPSEYNISDFIVTSNNTEVLTVSYKLMFARDVGTVDLTFTSPYNDYSETVTVNVVKTPPKDMIIIGPDIISPVFYNKYRAEHSPMPFTKDFKWEVVSGKATITDDGWLSAKTFGKVVIRCTSTLDPSISKEKTVSVKLFSDSYNFVRKFLGHGGLSALLGFGIFGTLFLLCKPKWLCAVLTPPLAFIYAGVSEGIQYFTPGRTCAITDVLTDFIGALIGMAIAILLIAIVLGIWRLASKDSFTRFVRAYNFLSFRTLFKRTPVLDEEEGLTPEPKIE